MVGCYSWKEKKDREVRRSKEKQKSLYCKVEGEIVQVTVKSHWQEPAVFSLT